jgi:hypothetical protein
MLLWINLVNNSTTCLWVAIMHISSLSPQNKARSSVFNCRSCVVSRMLPLSIDTRIVEVKS